MLPLSPRKKYLTVLLVVLTVLSLLLGLLFGAFPILFDFNSHGMSSEKWSIIWNLRAPRVLCCALIGALLACCGVISQTILRNPLACPYTLGISQLVSLIIFSILYLNTSAAVFLVGLIFVAVMILYRSISVISSLNSSLPQTLILLGLAIGTFCSSIILALQFALDGISLMQMTRWLMGSLSVVGYLPLIPLAVVLIILYCFAYRSASALDWFNLGDEIAMSRGVAVRTLTLTFCFLLFICVSLVVWSVGPIGFVGLIIPHTARLLGFVRHKSLLLISSLLGASFLCLSDVLARTIISPVEIPIGVVTGIIGTPVFVYLLVSGLRQKF
jgi:iron complex transport system permease protein